MNIESEYKCLKIEHEGQKIEGFCLNLSCQTNISQFCFKCNGDPKIHTNCKNDLMKFESINQFLSEFYKYLDQLRKQLKESQDFFMSQYKQFTEKLELIYKQFTEISQYCDQQKYHEIKMNINFIKEAYDFKNNKEENLKQNQIGVQLQQFIFNFFIINEVNKLIKAFQLYQAESQNNETVLDEAICLNTIKMKVKPYQISQNGRKQMIQYLNTYSNWINIYHLLNSFKALLYYFGKSIFFHN